MDVTIMLHVLEEYIFILRPNLYKDFLEVKKFLEEKEYEDEGITPFGESYDVYF